MVVVYMNRRYFEFTKKKDYTAYMQDQYLIELKDGRFLSALEKMEKLLAVCPDDFQVLYLRAKLHALNKDHEKALKDYNVCIKISPNYSEAYINRGFTKRSLGDIEGSESDFIAAARIANLGT